MKGQEISGITLIALVVTIIVLLILAGVSISMLTGQNGILNRVAEAKEKTGIAQSEEKVKLAVMAAIADGNGTLTIENLKKELANNGITIPDNATFPVTVTTGNSTYQIDQYGNITEASTVPQISYTVTNIDGSEITSSNLPESAKLNVTITNISELSVTSLKIKNSSGTEITGATVDVTKGTISTQITENGKYIVEIVATDKKGKNASASPEIQVSGKLKIANLEANWTAADSTNSNDDWYAYKDNSGTKAQVNVPKLADGMTAIKYSTDSDLTAGSKWANAMTKDGSMWVWIPRYAYKITYTNSSNKSAGGTINIAFLKDATNEFLDNTIQGEIKTNINDVTYTTNGDGTKSQDQWLVAPAFTLGTESIEGFWFAKFEASNTNDSATNNPDLTLQIKPNVTSWRSMTSLNMFTACQNLTSDSKYSTYFNSKDKIDTHMTKNVEWGAVAYLAHSKYGLNGDEIGINTNSSYKTGIGNDGSSVYNTEVGEKSSTTKNVYGVYDMSGGAWEYVAACYKTENATKLTDNKDTAYINKYIDVYESYNSPRFGDAVLETSSSRSGSTSWFSDYSSFVYSDYPVFGRGGHYDAGSIAGLFCFSNDKGAGDDGGGFRPVCVVK
ncbi:MAG: SUMF1/EgtB/PvdO family nonheme iron enzyme [Clostridia bacterium]